MRITEMTYRVPYADTDKMGVVYYANYYIYFERLRNELLRDADLPYVILEKKGIMLPVIESNCVYKGSAKYDDLITIKGWVESIKGVRIKIQCEVYNEAGELLVNGYTVHACINCEGRPVKPPCEILQLK